MTVRRAAKLLGHVDPEGMLEVGIVGDFGIEQIENEIGGPIVTARDRGLSH